MSEAEKTTKDYETIEELFTRRLKPNARPIHLPFCSPADGVISGSIPISDKKAIQAKGIEYSLIELLYSKNQDVASMPHNYAWATTVYLAPHNYHRVHAPFSGEIYNIRYLAGTLWSVNVHFVKQVINLYNQNERLVFDFRLDNGGLAFVVMIGAFNVGRMQSPLIPHFFTNDLKRQFLTAKSASKHWGFEQAKRVQAGDELGVFELGSTVVIVLDETAKKNLPLTEQAVPRPIQMGQSLLG